MVVTESVSSLPDGLAWRAAPRAAYVHIPFCKYHCGYCNFSIAAGRDYLIDRYLSAIRREIEREGQQHEVDSLYLGGGTPSRLTGGQLETLQSAIATRINAARGAEITIEANPADVSRTWLVSAKNFGATRISLGGQSFDKAKLKLLERDHTANQVRDAVALAKEFGFQVSIDLIFASPGESLERWLADLREAALLMPDHLSTYELTFEQGTQFWNRRRRGALTELTEEQRAGHYEATIDLLAAKGWEQYEISSFARGGAVCRHNCTYWTGWPYLAFGSGAARFLRGRRQTNHASTIHYIQLVEQNVSPMVYDSCLPADELARELLAIGLRQIRGVPLGHFHETTGLTVDEASGKAVAALCEAGLLTRSEDAIFLSRRGLMLYDSVAAEFAI